MAAQTLTSRAAYRIIIFSIVGSILMGLLEIYPPAFQYLVPGLTPVLVTAGGVVMFIFSIVVVRQFRSYPLHIKLVINFMLVALVPSSIVAFSQPQADAAQLRATELTLLVAAGLSGLAALGVAQFVAGPIERLTNVVEGVITGNLNTQAQVESGDEVGKLALTFNDMTTRLRQTLGGLETVAEVGGRLNAILDIDRLLAELVTQVRERFDFYHVQVYLLDSEHKNLNLAAGYGEAGAKMKAEGYRLALDDPGGLAPRAARERVSLLLADVGQEPGWKANPYLPDTRAELAVPILAEEQVVGVMDVQSDRVNGLDAGDIDLLRSLTNQVVVAMTNARLFEQIQQRAIELDKARETADFAREAADSAREDAENARVAAEEANRSLAAKIWQTAGQASLNEKMRGEQDIATLAHNVIQHLCKYLKTYSGAIYILEDKTLQLTGAYAYRRKSFGQHYQLGEDLVGQAAVEKEIISDEIPEDYVALSLRQGKVLPKYRLVAPVVYNQQVSGVIALESMAGFTQTQRNFLEEAIESVAIAFLTAQARARVNELFAQTRQQAEELRSQEEELRSTNEELETQTESLRASENRLKANQVALEAANVDLEEKTHILQEQQIALDHQNQVLR
ncbi:MAG: GAF domain-containing protein, partial [Anaerolineales bacterium]